MGGFAKAKGEVAFADAQELLGPLLEAAVAGQEAQGLRRQPPHAVHRPDAFAGYALVAGEADETAGRELGRDLQRVLVAVGMDEEIVGIDGPRNLVARLAADPRDVVAGSVVGGPGVPPFTAVARLLFRRQFGVAPGRDAITPLRGAPDPRTYWKPNDTYTLTSPAPRPRPTATGPMGVRRPMETVAPA